MGDEVAKLLEIISGCPTDTAADEDEVSEVASDRAVGMGGRHGAPPVRSTNAMSAARWRSTSSSAAFRVEQIAASRTVRFSEAISTTNTCRPALSLGEHRWMPWLKITARGERQSRVR